MRILGIDPGSEQSACVLFDGVVPDTRFCGIRDNLQLSGLLYHNWQMADTCVIEQIASYGMAVGATVFETCYWSGRFAEAWERGRGFEAHRLKRHEVKSAICHDSRAKDGNIRQALIDRFGGKGTKKKPGPFYGFRADMWQAAAVAVAWMDLHGAKGA